MTNILPENILKCMSPKDRKSLGKEGYTKEEWQEHGERQSERKLHNQIINLLSYHHIKWFGHGSMAHRSKYTEGWPDFVIPLPNGKTLYWEVKTKEGKLSQEQNDCLAWLSFNNHKVDIIRSYANASTILKENLRNL